MGATLARVDDWSAVRLAWSPDARLLAGVDAVALRLFTGTTVLRTPAAPAGGFAGLSVSPDGRFVLAAPWCFDVEGGWLPLAPLGPALAGGLRPPPHAGYGLRAAAWSGDASLLLAAADYRPARTGASVTPWQGPQERLVVVDGHTRRSVSVLEDAPARRGVRAVALTASWAVAADRAVRVWDRGTWRWRGQAHLDLGAAHVLACAGDLALVGTAGGGAAVVSLTRHELLSRWQAHDGDLTGVAFAPSGAVLTTGRDGRLRTWRPAGVLVGDVGLGAPGTALTVAESGEVAVSTGWPDPAVLVGSA